MKLFILRLCRCLQLPGAAVLAVCLALAGCETPGGSSSGSPTTASTGGAATGSPDDSADKVKVGEKITIEITDVPGAPAPFVQVVRDDGSVSLPLNNLSVIAAGKRRAELISEIHDLYVPRYYRRMTVNIKTEDRSFSVGGEVRQPGRLGYAGEVTIITAIQAAGDFTDFGDKKRVVIIRSNGKREVVNVQKAIKDPSFNVHIYPGDVITVPRRYL